MVGPWETGKRRHSGVVCGDSGTGCRKAAWEIVPDSSDPTVLRQREAVAGPARRVLFVYHLPFGWFVSMRVAPMLGLMNG